MRMPKILAGLLVVGALSAGCKSERQKEMTAWADKVCACKDSECASKEFMKGEKYVDRTGWEEADSEARDMEWDKAKACKDKLEKK